MVWAVRCRVMPRRAGVRRVPGLHGSFGAEKGFLVDILFGLFQKTAGGILVDDVLPGRWMESFECRDSKSMGYCPDRSLYRQDRSSELRLRYPFILRDLLGQR